MRANKEGLIADFTSQVSLLKVGETHTIVDVYGTNLPNAFYKYFWLMRCIRNESEHGKLSSFKRSFNPAADRLYLSSTCRSCRLLGSCQIYAAAQKPPENH